MNRLLLILLSASLAIAIAGVFALLISFETGIELITFGLSLINLLGLILLLKNGTLLRTSYFTLICICLVLIIIGSMFKISHWPGSSLLLGIGLLSIPVIYLVRYLKKPEKNWLALIKLLWVIASFSFSYLVVMHLVPKEIREIPDFIMFAGVIYFSVVCYKDRELLKK